MIVVGTRAHGERRRRALSSFGVDFHKSEWMEAGDDPALSPTIFLVEQPPNCSVPTHFHRQNQFQLFVHGGGSVGPQALQPVTVHYAGAYTGYGPLVSGPEGIHYFTIRPVCESGAIPIEEAREKMVRGPKRHMQAGPVDCASSDVLSALREAQVEDVIPAAEDGLGARVHRLPPGGRLDATVPSATAGTFVVVLSGTLLHGNIELGQWESLFVTSDEAFPDLRAGRQGGQAILLFMPPKAIEYSQ
ncbi:MAG: hypothetical protein V4540_06090 [Pseudomonadota bacterium]